MDRRIIWIVAGLTVAVMFGLLSLAGSSGPPAFKPYNQTVEELKKNGFWAVGIPKEGVLCGRPLTSASFAPDASKERWGLRVWRDSEWTIRGISFDYMAPGAIDAAREKGDLKLARDFEELRARILVAVKNVFSVEMKPEEMIRQMEEDPTEQEDAEKFTKIKGTRALKYVRQEGGRELRLMLYQVPHNSEKEPWMGAYVIGVVKDLSW